MYEHVRHFYENKTNCNFQNVVVSKTSSREQDVFGLGFVRGETGGSKDGLRFPAVDLWRKNQNLQRLCKLFPDKLRRVRQTAQRHFPFSLPQQKLMTSARNFTLKVNQNNFSQPITSTAGKEVVYESRGKKKNLSVATRTPSTQGMLDF